MKRLTRRDDDGIVLSGIETNSENGCYDILDCDWVEECIDRLAAYEDTGLEPEEIVVQDRTIGAFAKATKGVALSRVCKLAQADRDGKVVVLPCKVGDTVWFLRGLKPNRKLVETTVEKIVIKEGGVYMKLSANAMYETSCNSIGKTVFLTREEAEKALEARKGAEHGREM